MNETDTLPDWESESAGLWISEAAVNYIAYLRKFVAYLEGAVNQSNTMQDFAEENPPKSHLSRRRQAIQPLSGEELAETLTNFQALLDRYETFQKKAEEIYSKDEYHGIHKALQLAVAGHQTFLNVSGRVRKSTGVPYLIHLLEVSELCMDVRLPWFAIVGSLLHDLIEDVPFPEGLKSDNGGGAITDWRSFINRESNHDNRGPQIVEIIQATSAPKIRWSSENPGEPEDEDIKKIVEAIRSSYVGKTCLKALTNHADSENEEQQSIVEVIYQQEHFIASLQDHPEAAYALFIKLADALNNFQTMDFVSPAKQLRGRILLRLASALGWYDLAREMAIKLSAKISLHSPTGVAPGARHHVGSQSEQSIATRLSGDQVDTLEALVSPILDGLVGEAPTELKVNYYHPVTVKQGAWRENPNRPTTLPPPELVCTIPQADILAVQAKLTGRTINCLPTTLGNIETSLSPDDILTTTLYPKSLRIRVHKRGQPAFYIRLHPPDAAPESDNFGNLEKHPLVELLCHGTPHDLKGRLDLLALLYAPESRHGIHLMNLGTGPRLTSKRVFDLNTLPGDIEYLVQGDQLIRRYHHSNNGLQELGIKHPLIAIDVEQTATLRQLFSELTENDRNTIREAILIVALESGLSRSSKDQRKRWFDFIKGQVRLKPSNQINPQDESLAEDTGSILDVIKADDEEINKLTALINQARTILGLPATVQPDAVKAFLYNLLWLP